MCLHWSWVSEQVESGHCSCAMFLFGKRTGAMMCIANVFFFGREHAENIIVIINSFNAPSKWSVWEDNAWESGTRWVLIPLN